jgi:hypothetical protein
MKHFTKFSWPIAILLIALNAQSTLAQSKADIFDGKTPITWLGLDYTQATFINAGESGKQNASDLTNFKFTKVYIPQWNDLFLSEMKKFDVAKAMHRPTVGYALNVTESVNNAITKDFVVVNPSALKALTQQDISDLVKNYDFKGNTGIGMIFFIESMNKETEIEGAWVTFVDMQKKTVLFTTYLTSTIGGMGMRNNWADATYKMLKTIESDYNKWAK